MADPSLLPLVVIAEYGVLGTQLSVDKTVSQVAAEPDESVAITDPAGLPFIQKAGPSKAGGASGAIYQWLGIKADPSFPQPVRDSIKAPGQAKFHQYGGRKVIHIVGPNLNGVFGGAEIVDKVVQLLARAYANTLAQFVISGAIKLRLLPISGGIFAGRFADDMPWITFKALDKGFRSLGAGTQDELTRRFSENKLELCIFGVDSVSDFAAGLASGGEPPEGGAKVLSKLWPGSLALISGLEAEKAKQFNGTLCTVLQSTEGKYMVELENGAKATLPGDNVELAEGGVLVPGAPAKVSGLTATAGHKFNGTEAALKAWSKEHSKWNVLLKGGITANIPAINLRSLDSDAIDLESDEWIDLF